MAGFLIGVVICWVVFVLGFGLGYWRGGRDNQPIA
jgi:hypothetical protein